METRVQTEPNGGDDRRRGKRRRRMRRSEIHELMRWPQNSEGQELLMLKLKTLVLRSSASNWDQTIGYKCSQ
jgi:hypothetical protein